MDIARQIGGVCTTELKGVWGYKEEVHSKNCDLCEYGDYNNHLRQCCKMIDDTSLEITGDEWDFVKRMGCGTFIPVRDGNPRKYPKKPESK